MFWDKEKIISVYERSSKAEGDPYIRSPHNEDKDPKTKRRDRETGKVITLWQEKLRYPYKTRREATLVIKTTHRVLEIQLILEEDPFSKVIGWVWNGQNIPTLLWSILRISKHSPEGLLASKWHDYLLYRKIEVFSMIKEEGEKLNIKEYRRLTTLIFRELLKDKGVNVVKANVMAGIVGGWQFVSPQWWGIKD